MTEYWIVRYALFDMLRPKRLLGALVLVLVPVLLALFWRFVPPPAEYHGVQAYSVISPLVVFGFVLVIGAVLFGTGVLSAEMEQKTIVYLLTRPVVRWRLLMCKALAAFVAVAVVAEVAAIVTAFISMGTSALHSHELLRDLAIMPVGAAAYTSLFVLMATVLDRPLIYGLFFGFGWETLAPELLGAYKKLTIMGYIRVLAPHPNVPAGFTDQAAVSIFVAQGVSMHAAWLTLGGICCVCLLLACTVFSKREYSPRDDLV
ncbi:MAG: ABC transporter permease [Armatimonadetes bacterium]|nr:ABC transporter permease [Armatimonadota bacterium]MDE2205050.1 ABC transporter permease [Armatimonadota bacterium]